MLKKAKKITVGVGLGYGLVDAMGGGAFTIIAYRVLRKDIKIYKNY